MGKVFKEVQDLTYLSWSKIRNSSGTAGSFLKAYSEFGGKKIYYKLSNFDVFSGVTGHESVNEIIVDRLLTIFGIPHLSYELILAKIRIDEKEYEAWVCASEDYKQKNETKIALDEYYDIEHLPEESRMDFCVRMGWERYIYEMLAVDYIILNRDRHGANIEVLRDSKQRTVRLAPLFDHGLSLLYQCQTEKLIKEADIHEEKKVQSFFLGAGPSSDLLKLIPKKSLPVLKRLREEDKDFLFEDLEQIIDKDLMEKIWKMICLRWNCYESFRNQE